MFRNYWLVAWRLLQKDKLYSLIGTTGLAAGMAVALLIGLWVHDELTFNDWHANHATIARILSIETTKGGIDVSTTAPVPMEAELRSKYGSQF
ncbi:MAG TPA: hypothetical protein VN616_05310 [Puia sp.]|nr:hypothetical protein [Puia sp.]